MHKLLPAIMLCMALQPAWAATGPAGKAAGPGPSAPAPAAVELVASAHPGAESNSRPGPGPVIVAAAGAQDEEAATAQADTRRSTDRGVLLAALALMAGIVLRRWGAGQR